MKCIKDKKGYKCYYKYGQRWIRGRTMWSEGRQLFGNGEHIDCIVKTNLDTAEKSIATLAEHKRFLTEEGYKEFLLNEFVALQKHGFM